MRRIRYCYDKLYKTCSQDNRILRPHGGRYLERMRSMIGNKCYGLTNRGYVGLLPAQSRDGDIIAILYGTANS